MTSPTTYTLQTLITLARSMADEPGSGTASYITDSELTHYINAEMAKLDDMLCAAVEDYRLTSAIVTPTVNTGPGNGLAVALPADFYQNRGVDIYTGLSNVANPYLTMRPYFFPQRNDFSSGFLLIYPNTSAGRYSIQDGYYTFQPTNNLSNSQQFRVWYVPVMQELVNLTDAIPSYYANNVWIDAVIAGAAARCVAKDERDPSFLMQIRDDNFQRILSMSQKRDEGPPRRFMNTRKRQRFPWFGHFP